MLKMNASPRLIMFQELDMKVKGCIGNRDLTAIIEISCPFVQSMKPQSQPDSLWTLTPKLSAKHCWPLLPELAQFQSTDAVPLPR